MRDYLAPLGAFWALCSVVFLGARMASCVFDTAPATPAVVCAECAGPLVLITQLPNEPTVETRPNDTNRVYHVPMNEREYEFWVGFENSSEYMLRIYPEDVDL